MVMRYWNRSDYSDYNYRPEEDRCVLIGSERIISGQCDQEGDRYITSSGYRKIPGNTCTDRESNRKDDHVEKVCGKEGAIIPKPPTPIGDITSTQHVFEGGSIKYIYLERSETSSGDDETVIMHVGRDKLYISHDGGGEWNEKLEHENVVDIYVNPYFKDWVYFVTSNRSVFITRNRGKTIVPLGGPRNLPITQLERVPKFSFHPKRAGWLIWIGDQNCDNDGEDCHAFAQYTTDGGDTWHRLIGYVKSCEWIQGIKNSANESLIYCLQYPDQSGDQRKKIENIETTQLISSSDFFDTYKVRLKDVIGIVNLDEYVLAAYVDRNGMTLRMVVTIDGANFANADFPPRFERSRETAYTVLDSTTKSVFLHVTTSEAEGHEFGTLMKSNSNGTYYVTSVDSVNGDADGYVDFEKLQGLEGVALVNVVINADDVLKENNRKRLKTKITHNDGGSWSYLTPPKKDSEQNSYNCKVGTEECTLNLHGFTERKDVRDTYSSGSAVGILLGVGNVGEYLSPYNEGNTFISADAGVTWREVHKGPYTWEFGDQGGIIVAVKDDASTQELLYSEDQGSTWQSYKFYDTPLIIEDIATVPSDTSRRFLLIARKGDSDDRLVIRLDFSALHDRKCALLLVRS